MADRKISECPSARWLAVALSIILTAQIAGSHAISIGERPPTTPELRMLPGKIASWTLAEEQSLELDVAAYLKPDDYIMRAYLSEDRASSISLFVAYFKSLQNSYGPHSPRVCLPGSGWLTHAWKVVSIPVPERPDGIPVNEYVLEKNGQQILVVYWYQNGRRVWAEEFEVKLHLLQDLLRYRRSDVSLVRIITPLGRAGALEMPLKRATEFGGALFPLLAERFAHTE